MNKSLFIVGLILVISLIFTGCGGEEEAEEMLPENGAVDQNVMVDEDVVTEGDKLPDYFPLYPDAVFVEIEEDLTGQDYIQVFVYESDDGVEDIYNWYLEQIENSPAYEGVETEYKSDEFCKVDALMYIESWNNTINDGIQIDSRNRDNTQLRFIITNLDRLPGV